MIIDRIPEEDLRLKVDKIKLSEDAKNVDGLPNQVNLLKT